MAPNSADTTHWTLSEKPHAAVSRSQSLFLAVFLFLTTGLTVSCGLSGLSSNGDHTTSPVSISISPTSATVPSNGTQQFTASVSDPSDSAVTWTASAGKISGTGLFTAPTVTTTTMVSVTTTSVADPSKQASANVTVKVGSAQSSPSIVTATVPGATVDQTYNTQLSATGGQLPYQWSIASGALPPGIQLNSSSGAISGTASAVGSFPFTAKVTDTLAHSSVSNFTLNVASLSAPTIQTAAVPGATVDQTYSTQLSATGGQLPYQWSIASGALPQGIQLNGSSGTISGTTTVAGSFPFTAKVTDALAHSSAGNFTLNVASLPPPTIQTAAVPGAAVDQTYSAQLSATGGQLPYQWSIASGALPPGIQLNSASGEISGETKSLGSFLFTIEVTDAQSQSATANLALVVSTFSYDLAIPNSYFGIMTGTISDWPDVYVGSLGKASLVAWPYLETSKGVYDWSRLDAWVQAAESHGSGGFYFTNDFVPAWAAADPSSCSTPYDVPVCTSMVTNIQDWDDFVTALVTRYKGKIQMYELWNEPDGPYFTGTVAQMVTLTNEMYNIIRALDPNALIAAPSALYPWMDSYWAAGGVTTVDIVTTHSYPTTDIPYAEMICAYHTLPLKAVMQKYGIQKPIWATETSWGSTLSDPDLQAAFAARDLILCWACGVSRFYWYQWDSGPPTYWGTLWTPSTGISEAGVAFMNAETWLRGAVMPNSCLVNGAPIPPPPALYQGIYTCDLIGPVGAQAQAVWNMDGPSIYTAPDQFTQYGDLSGHTYPVPSNHEVAIGYEPILLEY